MKITIAGAGAGKTTKMAERLIAKYEETPSDKNIYCISFTNNAVSCIKEKIKKHFNNIPSRIHIETIHSFLYQEIVKPYYYLLFMKSFDHISSIDLGDPRYKASKFQELEKKNILHVEAITQRALWVFVKKSRDNREIKDKRKIIQSVFTKYCGGVFIDEAQDMDGHIYDIIIQLEKLKVFLEVIGDPKQDLRGYKTLRNLVELYKDDVIYIKDCHRCPSIHLQVSNSLINKKEWQDSKKDVGFFCVLFEMDIDVRKFIEERDFDLKYIYRKNGRFNTHNQAFGNIAFESINYELYTKFKELYTAESDLIISRRAYFMTNKIIREYKSGQDVSAIIKKMFNSIQFTKSQYARLCAALCLLCTNEIDLINVSSIESIKGQEGENCLFVLTVEVAKYLFGENIEENKVLCALYVALTRSLRKITILITTEVEEKYTREKISKFFRRFNVQLLS